MSLLYIWLFPIGHTLHNQVFTNLEEKIMDFELHVTCPCKILCKGTGEVVAQGLHVHDLHMNGP